MIEIVQNCTVTGFDFPWWGWAIVGLLFVR